MAAITPVELKKKMDNGHVIILDVREPFEYKDWHIPGAVNVPVSSVMRNPELEIPKESEIIAVCSHGIRSASAVRYLNMAGFNARSLAGGMVEWNGVYDFIEISEDIIQVRRVGKGCLSYILISGGEAAVIDPAVDVDIYTNWAKGKNLNVAAVIDTHAHADHTSGGRMMAKSGIPYYAPVEVGLGNPIKGGDKISIGSLELSAMAAPGHTKGSLVYRTGRFIFTGDTLFTDSVGRPDLGQKASENAPLLYDTIQRLLALPDNIIVLPAHSEIDAIRKEVPIKETIEELRELPVLRKSKDEFVSWVSESMPPPENFEIIKEYNTGKIVIDSLEEFRELEAGANRCAVK